MILYQVPDEINGFSRTEYLSVFIGILYAAVASEFLSGWGKMFRNRKELTFSMELVLWSIVLFAALLLNWYGVWPRLQYVSNSFGDFILILIPIIIFYFLAILLFPEIDKEYDLKNHLEKNVRLILIFFVSYLLMQLFYGVIFDGESIFTINSILRLAAISLGVIAFVTGSIKWRSILLCAGFIIMSIAGYKLA